MKKENKFLGLLIVLVMLSSIFTGCVGQKSNTTISYQEPTTGTSDSTPKTPDTTPQTGTPLILAGMSYDTETVDRNNRIYLSVKNHGSGKATNVIIIISNDYYSNFSLQSVNPSIKVEGNKFYIGDMAGGETFVLNIYLKAKQSGVYSGTISYTYNELGGTGKIMDVTTRVP